MVGQRQTQGLGVLRRSLMAPRSLSPIDRLRMGNYCHLLRRELSARNQVIGIMVVNVLIGLRADKDPFSPWERFSTAVGPPD